MPDVSNLTLSGARPGQGQTNEVGNFQMSLLGHFTPPATLEQGVDIDFAVHPEQLGDI